jgi:hypothetical protein
MGAEDYATWQLMATSGGAVFYQLGPLSDCAIGVDRVVGFQHGPAGTANRGHCKCIRAQKVCCFSSSIISFCIFAPRVNLVFGLSGIGVSASIAIRKNLIKISEQRLT